MKTYHMLRTVVRYFQSRELTKHCPLNSQPTETANTFEEYLYLASDSHEDITIKTQNSASHSLICLKTLVSISFLAIR